MGHTITLRCAVCGASITTSFIDKQIPYVAIVRVDCIGTSFPVCQSCIYTLDRRDVKRILRALRGLDYLGQSIGFSLQDIILAQPSIQKAFVSAHPDWDDGLFPTAIKEGILPSTWDIMKGKK